MKKVPVLLLGLFILFTAAQARADREFEGTLAFGNMGDYRYLDFYVPEGTTKITVAYSYADAAADMTSDEAAARDLLESAFGAALIRNVVDLGVYDPNGFRGWSGSNKHQISVALSKEETTDSYVPGEIPTGMWSVELGAATILPGTRVDYIVTVVLSDEDVGETFVPTPYEPVVLSTEKRWYKGDLHCHSTHSDGSRTMAQVFDYAKSIGLDFIALTDHNAISQYLYLPDLQPDYPDMLLIPGGEMTSYRGHANVFNYPAYVDYHGTQAGYDINAVIDDVHAAGGYFSPNHPSMPFIVFPGLTFGLGWAFPETDFSKLDSWEYSNTPTILGGIVPNPFNALALNWWDNLQALGIPLAIRGGSDDHQGGQGSGATYSPIGQPTTVVYAEELSAVAILEAISAGHAFVMNGGPDGAEIYLTAQSSQGEAIMGDTLMGDEFQITVRVVNGKRHTLSILWNGEPMPLYEDRPVSEDDFTLELTHSPASSGRLRAEVRKGGLLKTVTNSIFLEKIPSRVTDDDADDTTDDTDSLDDAAPETDSGDYTDYGPCGC